MIIALKREKEEGPHVHVRKRRNYINWDKNSENRALKCFLNNQSINNGIANCDNSPASAHYRGFEHRPHMRKMKISFKTHQVLRDIQS